MDRNRGIRRDQQQHPPIKVQIDVAKATDTGRRERSGEWAILIRSAHPPGAALWHLTVDQPLRSEDEAELAWAARNCGFDQRDATRQIREAVRSILRPEGGRGKASARRVPADPGRGAGAANAAQSSKAAKPAARRFQRKERDASPDQRDEQAPPDSTSRLPRRRG